jgi:chromosome segregation ATPase
MKIISLVAENIKKLRAVEIAPDGEIVNISGRNGQGKTSVLDSIWWALSGTKNIQGEPIRKGETKARIRLDLGEIVVERKFSESGSTLAVESAEGARFPSPQKMLDALLGELSFDPLAFARMEPRKQFDELRRVSKLEVDIDKLDGLNASDYAKRTDVNREAKAKRAQAAGIVVSQDAMREPVDESALVEELQRAGEKNTEIESRKARRDVAHTEAQSKRTSAKELGERAAALRREADALDAKAADCIAMASDIEKKLAEAPALPQTVDVTALRKKIDDARALNAAIARHTEDANRKARLIDEAAALEARSTELTESIQARETAKAQAIKNAAMPVAGLGFGDGHVTYNGIPFDQASSAEQLRVSMSIAMASNPKLRVIRIVDGSLLDEDSMAAIGAMAKAEDFQVWIERVDSSGKLGIVIDDGAVVGQFGVVAA